MARPNKQIDWKAFERLLELELTLKEIAQFFGCSEDTVQRLVYKEKKKSFSEYYSWFLKQKNLKGPKKGPDYKEINWAALDNLCGIMCTLEEIAGTLGCSEDTIEKAVLREKKMLFEEYVKSKRGKGLASLRRMQFILAEKNAAMAKWLGEQYLGQTNKTEFKGSVTNKTIDVRQKEYSELTDEELDRRILEETKDAHKTRENKQADRTGKSEL